MSVFGWLQFGCDERLFLLNFGVSLRRMATVSLEVLETIGANLKQMFSVVIEFARVYLK
jgi:hypothetical protein